MISCEERLPFILNNAFGIFCLLLVISCETLCFHICAFLFTVYTNMKTLISPFKFLIFMLNRFNLHLLNSKLLSVFFHPKRMSADSLQSLFWLFCLRGNFKNS